MVSLICQPVWICFKYWVNRHFIPTDQNTLILLKDYTVTNGRNSDVLIKIEKNHITAKTLTQLMQDPTCRVDLKLCYNYSAVFPWTSHVNLKETVFKGWNAPSFYLNFKEQNSIIVVSTIPQHTISLQSYINIAKNKIEENMKKILDSSKDLVLLYSRGVDSLLLLSYLIKYDRLKDTKLIHCGNTATKTPYLNFSLEKKIGIDIDTIYMPNEVVIEYANQTNPFEFRMCQAHWIAEKFKDKTVLIGYDGNSVLMHKWEWVKRLGLPVTDTNCYVDSCDTIDWSTPTDLDHHTISMIEPFGRSWSNPEKFDNMLSPISDPELMRMLPFIDIRTMNPNFIGNAEMIRTMIYETVGTIFDELIVAENVTWAVPTMHQLINTDRLLESVLTVDIKRRVDMNGIASLLQRVDQAREKKVIDFRCLLSIKYINYFA